MNEKLTHPSSFVHRYKNFIHPGVNRLPGCKSTASTYSGQQSAQAPHETMKTRATHLPHAIPQFVAKFGQFAGCHQDAVELLDSAGTELRVVLGFVVQGRTAAPVVCEGLGQGPENVFGVQQSGKLPAGRSHL